MIASENWTAVTVSQSVELLHLRKTTAAGFTTHALSIPSHKVLTHVAFLGETLSLFRVERWWRTLERSNMVI